MVVRRHVMGVLTLALAPLDVRVDRLPLDRTGTDERDLNGEIVEVLRPRSKEALHLRPAFDLEETDCVCVLDLAEYVRVVQGDAREVDGLAPKRDDLVDAL